MSDLFDRAHARNTDPGTSHEAAAAATLGIERQRGLVNGYAKARGERGFMDIELEEAHPLESDSGLRTRRSELTARNIVLDSGRRDRAAGSNRKRIVWVHRDYVENAPPIRDAPASPAQLDALKAEVLGRTKTLRVEADGLRRAHGLSIFAAWLEDFADLVEQLAT